jgi:hypothetical protein
VATETELLEGLARLNASAHPTVDLPVFVGNTRHGCVKHRLSGPEGRQISTALEVHEAYVYGWRGDEPILEDDGSQLALIYKEGRCRNRCGFTGRSLVAGLCSLHKCRRKLLPGSDRHGFS